MLGMGGLAGFFAFGDVLLAQPAQLSPAQTVAFRFPTNWNSAPAAPTTTTRPAATKAPVAPKSPAAVAAATPATAAPTAAARENERYALASLMFSPAPTYELASASSTLAVPATLPERANAYADPTTDGSDARRPTAAPAAVAKSQVDKNSTSVARQAKLSNNVFNDAQIASIKARLKLTADQQRHWPGVESALRNITYKKDGSRAGKMAAVDPNSAGVQQLKSSAIPLIMSFNEEQKSEVRQLARLMGLEQVASSF